MYNLKYKIMNFEKQNNIDNFENIKRQIKEKIDSAKDKAFNIDEFIKISGEIESQKNKFLETGGRTPEDLQKDEEIKKQIVDRSAIVDTIPEYREMLEQIAKEYNKSSEWVVDTLAHENAHANQAENLDYDINGFGGLFLKDENSVNQFQPFHLHEGKNNWEPIEVLEKEIITLEAPDKYGNKMSDDDIIEAESAKLLLEQEKEKIRQAKITEARNKLNQINTA
jgi:hypothetical protein